MAEWGTRNKTSIMSGVREHVMRSRFLKRNTIEYFPESGARIVRLHDTDIVKFPNPEDKYHFILNSGGWRTPTTKERMNDVLPSGVAVYQNRGYWYVRIGGWEDGKTVPFFDGIEIKAGVVQNPESDGAADEADKERIRKLIRKYTAKVSRQWAEAPMTPTGGDCWICMSHTNDLTKSARLPNTDCLISHLEEGYVHGTLVYNALLWAGYGPEQIRYVFGMRSLIVRAVRRYLKAQLGMEAR